MSKLQGIIATESISGFKIHSSSLSGKIGYNKTGFPNFGNDLVTNLVDVFCLIDPESGISSGLYCLTKPFIPSICCCVI